MADGILLEQVGLAAAVVCTDVFQGSADAMAAIRGFPGYRYVAVPHPVASRTGEELEKTSRDYVDEVAQVLGSAQPRREEKGQADAGHR